LGEKFGGLAADGGNTALKTNMYIAQGVALGYVLAGPSGRHDDFKL